MSWRRLVLLLLLSAAAGTALGWTLIPKPPPRALDPVAVPPGPPRPSPSAEARAASRALGRYSARATPAWIQLGTALTAAGEHDLAARVEGAQAGLRVVRDDPAPDLEAFAIAQRRLLAEIQQAPAGAAVAHVTARLETALRALSPATAALPGAAAVKDLPPDSLRRSLESSGEGPP